MQIVSKIKSSKFVQFFASIDRKISNALEYKVRYSPKLASLFILFKQLIDLIGFPVFGVLLFITAPQGNLLTGLWLTVLILNELIVKRIFKRQRPFMFDGDWSEKSHLFGYAFPSSHAYTAGFFITVWLSLHLPYPKIMIPMFTIIPISRVVLNYHYVGDVVIGTLIGVAWAIISLGFVK